MFQRILIPLDGSRGSEQAIPVAASLARQAGGTLVLLHVISPATALKSAVPKATRTSERKASTPAYEQEASQTKTIERMMTEAASYLATIPRLYEHDLTGLAVEMDVAFGAASPTLPSTARLEHVDLIVLCRHREVGIGQWGLESITQQVMRHSPVPLLILNGHEKHMPMLDGTHPVRVVVPLDGSLFAETILEPAINLLTQSATPQQRELCLLRVVDLFAGDGLNTEETHMSPYTAKQARQYATRYLQAVAERLRKRADWGINVQITCQVTMGVDIASAILSLREQETEAALPPTIIALATHGREGLERQEQESVAEHLLNTTTLPILTVCPGETVNMVNYTLLTGGKN